MADERSSHLKMEKIKSEMPMVSSRANTLELTLHASLNSKNSMGEAQETPNQCKCSKIIVVTVMTTIFILPIDSSPSTTFDVAAK